MHAIKAVVKRYFPQPVVKTLRHAHSWLQPRNQQPPPDPGLNEYWQQELQGRYDFFRTALTALKFNCIAGDYAEFGCNTATTFSMAYRLLAHYPYDLGPFHLWAYDSFQGMPKAESPQDAHPQWIAGNWSTPLDEFHASCQERGVPRTAYTVVPGFYEQSLDPAARGPHPDKIRLAYIDCDMYSSTRAVLRFLMPRIQHGMILAFDDYYCCSATMPSGERMAVAEAFAGNLPWRLVPYHPFGWHGMSFIVEATANGIPSGNHEAHW
jgi:O-methyltransferase